MQIIGVLREHEADAKTADLARKHGVAERTLYNWKAKYGGTAGYLTPATYAAHLTATCDRLRNRTGSTDRALF
jgi:transposase-like protein